MDAKETFVEVKMHTRCKKHPGRKAIPGRIETQIQNIDSMIETVKRYPSPNAGEKSG